MTILYPRICSSWRLVFHQLQFVTEHLLSTQLTWHGGFSSLPPLLLLTWKELAALCTGTAKAMGEAGIYTHPCDGGTSSCGMSSWSKQPSCPSVPSSSLCTAQPPSAPQPLSHLSSPAISFPVLTLPHPSIILRAGDTQGAGASGGKAMSGPHAAEVTFCLWERAELCKEPHHKASTTLAHFTGEGEESEKSVL